MKKKKRGTTLKPPIKPCPKCVKVGRCNIENEFNASTMHWRFRSRGRIEPKTGGLVVDSTARIAKKCKRFWQYLEKVDSFADQGHVSQQGDQWQAEWSMDLMNLRSKSVHFHRNLIRKYEDRNYSFLSKINNRILHLFNVDGLKHREIVRVLNGGRNPKTAIRLTVGAVKKRKSRATAKIDKWIAEYTKTIDQKVDQRPQIIRVKTSERIAARAKKNGFHG